MFFLTIEGEKVANIEEFVGSKAGSQHFAKLMAYRQEQQSKEE